MSPLNTVLALMPSVSCQSSPLLPYLTTPPSISHMDPWDGISRVKYTNPTLSESHCDLYNPKWLLQSFIYENVSHPSLSYFPSSFSFSSYSLSAFMHYWDLTWNHFNVRLHVLSYFQVVKNRFFFQCSSAGWAFWLKWIYEDAVSWSEVPWSPSGAWC